MGLFAGLPHVLHSFSADPHPPPSLSVLFCHRHERTHSHHRSYLQKGVQEIHKTQKAHLTVEKTFITVARCSAGTGDNQRCQTFLDGGRGRQPDVC